MVSRTVCDYETTLTPTTRKLETSRACACTLRMWHRELEARAAIATPPTAAAVGQAPYVPYPCDWKPEL
jgi:hypothetical protein